MTLPERIDRMLHYIDVVQEMLERLEDEAAAEPWETDSDWWKQGAD